MKTLGSGLTQFFETGISSQQQMLMQMQAAQQQSDYMRALQGLPPWQAQQGLAVAMPPSEPDKTLLLLEDDE